MAKKQVVVIGGGPGGYVAAIRLAQLGAAVTIVEKDALGGTCLNRGCIPTKVLLHTVDLYEQAKNGKKLGFSAENCRVDWSALQKRKKQVVSTLTGGVGMLLQKRGVNIVGGAAAFVSPREVEVTAASGNKSRLAADAFIIAAGSETAIPPVPGLDLPGIATSTEALELAALPSSLLLVGGGVIGVELAGVFAPLGVTVTIVEMLPRILPNVDEELAALLHARLEALGVTIHTGAALQKVEARGQGFQATVKGESVFTVAAEQVLAAAGRKPSTAGLGLELAGVKTERGRICVDGAMRTSAPGIYAVGDCASPIMLAHVASKEGEVAAENIMGHEAVMEYKAIPGAIYTNPEIAWAGLSEREAKAAGHDVVVGRFPLMGNGKSLVMDDTGGMVKVVADRRYNEMLGVHIIGPRATELIAEAVLALRLEATLEDVAAAVHAHPTVSEAVAEGALAALGRAIHAL